MAEIVAISDRQARAPRRPPALGGEAEILLFTGIRYERTDRYQRCGERSSLAAPGLPVAGKPPSASDPFAN